MQHVVNVKTKSDLTYSAQPELIEARYCEPARIRQVWLYKCEPFGRRRSW